MFSIEEIASLVTKNYQRSAIIKPLPGERDLNYYLEDLSGQKYILKIANEEEIRSNIELQHATIKHLAGKNTSLHIPQLIESTSKDYIVIIEDKKGKKRFMRLLTWVEGRPLAEVNPHTTELLEKLGALCGILSRSLKDFDHKAAHRFLKWNPSEGLWVGEKLHLFSGEHKEPAAYFFNLFKSCLPVLSTLRQSVTYHDANDYNILAGNDLHNPSVSGVIDFGDVTYTHTVNELAIALAYGMMRKPDPLAAAYHMVRGFNEQFELTDKELKVLLPLACSRLLISVTCSAINLKTESDNEYLQISDEPAWELLFKLRTINPALAYYRFREACGKEPCPTKPAFMEWVKQTSFAPLIKPGFDKIHIKYLDLSVGSTELGGSENIASIEKFDQRIQFMLEQSKADIGIGKYNEIRPIYTTNAYIAKGNDGPARRSLHIGLDVFAPKDTELLTPLKGIVFGISNNTNDRNYGPTIILKHEISPALTFYTLYGHLSAKSIKEIKPGQIIVKGERVGSIGSMDENGHWPSHLHFQIILDMLGNQNDFPGVAYADQYKTWTSICPDPGLLMGLNQGTGNVLSQEDIMAYRKKHLSKNLSVSYRQPLKILRGLGQYLFDASGRKYLDTVNNVAHVGHEHPRVVKAGQNQMAVLNTNTRYLHENIVRFAEEVIATMPNKLNVVYVVNSGSEANELALRLARNQTRAKEMIVVEAGYHGNTGGCVEISSYKFDGPGGSGAPSHIHVVPMPNTYRGRYKKNDPEAGKKYAKHIEEAIDKLKGGGRQVAGFICESVLSCGGQIPLPKDYLKEAYKYVRETGGVCIADEVQTGCGRSGDHFWAFEVHGVVPDIVTIGKPIGNGHPLGVVVTTQEIADSFCNGMEYFNTYGGNPVSSAIGLEVLSVIKTEKLQQNAGEVGAYLTTKLLELKDKYLLIGDVRGPGLFIGVELVEDRETLHPATEKASYLVNRMRELGILMSTDGPFNNVLKIKPPIIFNKQDVNFITYTLNRVLQEDFLSIQ